MKGLIFEIKIVIWRIWYFIYNHTWRHVLVWNDKRMKRKLENE